MKALALVAAGVVVGLAGGVALAKSAAAPPFASVIEREADIAVKQPGPHKGGGETTAFPFFSKAPEFKMAFRKRVMHPGSAIGYHEQKEDEVYYILSGTGEFTLNGVKHPVSAGSAMLTRPGSSHGLKQVGKDDLVLIIAYELK